MRYREDNPEDLDRARAAVAVWREKYPEGTEDPGSLRRLLGDLLERIENSAMITCDILQILKAPDGPLRADDRAALAIEVAALREDIARDLADDDTNLQVTMERVDRELAAISATLTAAGGHDGDDAGPSGQ